MLSIKQLRELRDDNSQELKDIQEICIDNKELSKVQRIEKYIEQIKNPYHFKCGNVTVKLEFENNAERLEDIFAKFLISKNCDNNCDYRGQEE